MSCKSLLLLIIPIFALAAPTRKQLTQFKNDVATVRGTLKSGKNLAGSEATVRKYLADSTFANEETHMQQLLCDVLKKAYEVGNEKMYLKQPADTVCLVNTGKRMFLAYERLDTLDASGRRRNAAYLLPYRTNIFMGGVFFLRKKAWREAWECFDIYLQCPRTSLFSESALTEDDETTYRVAFLSLITAHHLNSLPMAQRYDDKSVRSKHGREAYEILSEMAMNHGDTLSTHRYLAEGFDAHRTSQYLFSHLVDYLCNSRRYDEALAACDTAITADSLNASFIQGKHIVLMNMECYDESVEWGKKALERNDSLDTPYYNIGYIYYQRAQKVLGKLSKPYRQRLKEAQKHFRQLLPYMERYRALRPDDSKRWKPILYDAYLNLNMGKEFSEINK